MEITRYGQIIVTSPDKNANLINGKQVIALHITSLPGNIFQLGETEDSRIVIGPTGNLDLNSIGLVLTYLSFVEGSTRTYPTIIDYVYKTTEGVT